MDHSAPLQHHLSRPRSQQDLRDPRYAPIPPPPFSARPTSARPEILHSGDPFLQRRVEPSDPHRNTIQSQPYRFANNASYASSSVGSHRQEQTRRGNYGPLIQDRHEHLRQYGPPLSDVPTPHLASWTLIPVRYRLPFASVAEALRNRPLIQEFTGAHSSHAALPPPPPSSLFNVQAQSEEPRHRNMSNTLPANSSISTMFAGQCGQVQRRPAKPLVIPLRFKRSALHLDLRQQKILFLCTG
ncbi:MAG: hypothetical protein Q9172_000859 [Xanthocarpia lactea]